MSGRCVLASLLALCVVTLPTWAGSAKKINSADKVKLSLQTYPVDQTGNQKIVIYIDVQKGHYIYANPVNNKIFADNATEVSITTPSGKPSYKVIYPKPMVKRDETLGAFDIYKGKVRITTTVQRTKSREPLRFNVRVNACTDSFCYPVGNIPFSVR